MLSNENVTLYLVCLYETQIHNSEIVLWIKKG